MGLLFYLILILKPNELTHVDLCVRLNESHENSCGSVGRLSHTSCVREVWYPKFMRRNIYAALVPSSGQYEL